MRSARAKFAQDHTRNAHKRAASRTAFHNAIAEEQKSAHADWQKAVASLDKPLAELEALIASIKEESSAPSNHTSHEHNGHSKFLQIFGAKKGDPPQASALIAMLMRHTAGHSAHHQDAAASATSSTHLADSKIKKLEKSVQDLRAQQKHLATLSGRPAPDFRRLSFDGTAFSPSNNPDEASRRDPSFESPPPTVQEHAEEEDDQGSMLTRTDTIYHDALTPQEYNIEVDSDPLQEPTSEDRSEDDEQDEDEDDDDDDFESTTQGSTSAAATTAPGAGVQRRTKLPSPVVHGGSSVMSVRFFFFFLIDCYESHDLPWTKISYWSRFCATM